MGIFSDFFKRENKSIHYNDKEKEIEEIDKCLAEADKILGTHLHKDEDTLPALYDKAIDLIFQRRQASASLLERYFQISFRNACDILDYLESCEIIGEFSGPAPRKILVPTAEKAKIMAHKSIKKSSKADCRKIIQDEINWRREQVGLSSVEDELQLVDSMEGHEFEYWCAELLRKNGFTDVEVTKGSGDQGVDVLAVKDGIRYAIQCKCYSSNLGNGPVQEVNAGKSLYRCHVGVVMTNRHFTPSAKELATATGVLLWDRDKLEEMLIAAAP